jgi:hypothetical protein
METATFWVALGVIAAAFIARGVKISEFRQAWIDGLRSDISDYVGKSHKWIDMYIAFNSGLTIEEKNEIFPKLERLKHDALKIHSRISLRFKPDDRDGNVLLEKLLRLLDPLSLTSSNTYSTWRDFSDDSVTYARVLLKEEWETTKNPFRKNKLKSSNSILIKLRENLMIKLSEYFRPKPYGPIFDIIYFIVILIVISLVVMLITKGNSETIDFNIFKTKLAPILALYGTIALAFELLTSVQNENKKIKLRREISTLNNGRTGNDQQATTEEDNLIKKTESSLQFEELYPRRKFMFAWLGIFLIFISTVLQIV